MAVRDAEVGLVEVVEEVEVDGEEGLSRASKYCSIAFRTVSMTSFSSIVGGKLVVDGRGEEERNEEGE